MCYLSIIVLLASCLKSGVRDDTVVCENLPLSKIRSNDFTKLLSSDTLLLSSGINICNYVFKEGPGVINTYYSSFAPGESDCSKYMLRMSSRWIIDKDSLLGSPLVGELDIDNDGVGEFFTTEKVHNGTSYNGTIIRYIKPSLTGLEVLMALESSTLIPADNCMVYRTIDIDSEVQVVLECPDQVVMQLGTYQVDWSGLEPRITDRSILLSRYSDYLVTGSGVADSIFIVHGNRPLAKIGI